jgi:uncharacterized Zn finger protein
MTENISESVIRSLATSESFARGRELYQSGAIFDTVRRGNLLMAKCEGSLAPVYQLRVELDEGGIRETSCTCPYDWGGLCKHLVALLLTFIHHFEVFSSQKGIVEQLADLDKDTLVSLIAKMVDHNPGLYSWLEAAIPAISIQSKPNQPRNKRQSQVSQAEYRRQIQGVLHSLRGYRRSEAYWMMGGMVEQLDHIRDTAYEFLKAGDVDGALIILTTLLTDVSGSYGQFDDSDGMLGDFLNGLSLPFVEAILSAELNKTQRRNLEKELEPVIEELSNYGIEDLDVVLAALRTNGAENLEDYDFDETILTEARLNVLECQGRGDDYLKLCLDTGEYLRFILKQIEVGEFDKAFEVAMESLTQAVDALNASKALRDGGHLAEALQLAEKGLGLQGSRHELGTWLGSIELAQGRKEQAIQAYWAAFISLPSLGLYNTLKDLSGAGWDRLRSELMEVLKAVQHADVLVDVYLSEEDWDKAIAVANRAGEWNYPLIEKVADAILPFRPDWVIKVSQKQAEGLIGKTQSKYYVAAGRWLAKIKQAYSSSGRKADWQAYLDGLKTTYSRRPALQAELRKL